MKHKISVTILFILAFLGMSVIVLASHEYSHFYDFQEIAENEEICLLTSPTSFSEIFDGQRNAAYYKFDISEENVDKYQKIQAYTEKKAMVVGTLVFIVFLIIFLVILNVLRTAVPTQKLLIGIIFGSALCI